MHYFHRTLALASIITGGASSVVASASDIKWTIAADSNTNNKSGPTTTDITNGGGGVRGGFEWTTTPTTTTKNTVGPRRSLVGNKSKLLRSNKRSNGVERQLDFHWEESSTPTSETLVHWQTTTPMDMEPSDLHRAFTRCAHDPCKPGDPLIVIIGEDETPSPTLKVRVFEVHNNASGLHVT